MSALIVGASRAGAVSMLWLAGSSEVRLLAVRAEEVLARWQSHTGLRAEDTMRVRGYEDKGTESFPSQPG